jgi:hypothetical protein
MAIKKKTASLQKSTRNNGLEPVKIQIEIIVKSEGNQTFREVSLFSQRAILWSRNVESTLLEEVSGIVNIFSRDDIPSVEFMVKTSILRIAGRTGDPLLLGDDEELGDLFTSDPQYVMLRAALEAIARLFNRMAVITLKEVMDCSTVKDCIDLVNSKKSKT